MRALALLSLLMPGCYLAFRGGPSYQGGGSLGKPGVGFDWQLTAGIEFTVATTGSKNAFDPFAGRVHLGIGGGGGEASTTTTRLSGGGGGLVGRYTLAKQEWTPGNGTWIDVKGEVGGGYGTTQISDGRGNDLRASGGLFNVGAASEFGIHGGGASQGSIGLVLGLGLSETMYNSSLGGASSFSPYAEAKLEGAALAEIAVALLFAAH
jgi:hypothetical protein